MTEQLVAVYVVPLGPYVAVTEPTGPKFVPLIVTTVPPAVGIEPPPATDEITGGVYDTVATDAELGCDPTVTIHVKDAPKPETDVHWSAVFAVVTEHDVALYPVPLAPYVAVTGLPNIGPKFVPASVTTVPPAVGIDDPPVIPLIAGTA